MEKPYRRCGKRTASQGRDDLSTNCDGLVPCDAVASQLYVLSNAESKDRRIWRIEQTRNTYQVMYGNVGIRINGDEISRSLPVRTVTPWHLSLGDDPLKPSPLNGYAPETASTNAPLLFSGAAAMEQTSAKSSTASIEYRTPTRSPDQQSRPRQTG